MARKRAKNEPSVLSAEIADALGHASDAELGEVLGGALIAFALANARPGADPIELARAVLNGRANLGVSPLARAKARDLSNLSLEAIARRLSEGDTAEAGRLFREYMAAWVKADRARRKGGRRRMEKKPEVDKPRDDAIVAEAARLRAAGIDDRNIVPAIRERVKRGRVTYTDTSGKTAMVKVSEPTIRRILRDRGFFPPPRKTKNS